MQITEQLTSTQIGRTRFLVYFRDFLRSLEVNEIAFFYSQDKETHLVTHSNENYLHAKSLNWIETKIDKNRFFRISRMFIVSYDCIQRIEPYFGNRLIVFVKSDTNVKAIVSREKVAEFKTWLGE